MSALATISLRVAGEPGAANAQAIMREVEALLERLAAGGESGAIDLRALPLAPADLELLARELGEGEVSASIQANGLSVVRETAYPGIWWVTHHDESDAVVAEFIEVCAIPEVLKSQQVDMDNALVRLRQRTGRAAPT
jgi:hydrogenase-1 operon protein HyaF